MYVSSAARTTHILVSGFRPLHSFPRLVAYDAVSLRLCLLVYCVNGGIDDGACEVVERGCRLVWSCLVLCRAR